MAKNNKKDNKYIEYAFFNQLREYYIRNRKEIRKTYKTVTKKFLDYNDIEENPNAWLRRPQFEALEMYVFIKEYLDNKTMQEIFKIWMEEEGVFSDRKEVLKISGFLEDYLEDEMPQLESMKKYLGEFYKEYPNYIYALTMGLGKTVLMATCILYEFLLASKFADDERFCHNALVFAPDKTVLESLREITNMDKSKVIPQEYLSILDANISFYFLDDKDSALPTIEGSEFNIIISNTQKIILKKKNKDDTVVDQLFKQSNNTGQIGSLFENLVNEMQEEGLIDESNYLENQRFQKLKKLDKLGVYVDEAHHMYGNDLEKELINNKSSLRVTIDTLHEEFAKAGKRLIACYNFTGTPYIENRILPEVVYSYGLKPAIDNGYLKDIDPHKYENVKEASFLNDVIKDFFTRYKDKTYEGLLPKLAIFAAEIKEIDEIRPIVEKALSDIGMSSDKILVNVGDEKKTKDEDIRDFNNLDVVGSNGANKQVILLVGKGREGWNCRSLFGVAMYRSPKSNIFVLQATMRCLRQITNEKQTGCVYLSNDNYEILNDELAKNYRTSIEELKEKTKKDKKRYQVRVNLPEKKIKIKKIDIKYIMNTKEYTTPIDFSLDNIDEEKYKSRKFVKNSIVGELGFKEVDIDVSIDKTEYSLLTLITEIKKYFNDVKCVTIEKILRESKDGIDKILEKVSLYNDLINDVIVKKIFDALYDVKREVIEREEEVILLKAPIGDAEYYDYIGDPNLVVKENSDITEVLNKKCESFHADTYIFDSNPEKQLFLEALISDDVKECYFTGMFTNEKTGFSITYIDPSTNSLRHYYPDFVVRLKDDTYRIIEVKADFQVDNEIVKAKERATKEILADNIMKYQLIPSSKINNSFVGLK